MAVFLSLCKKKQRKEPRQSRRDRGRRQEEENKHLWGKEGQRKMKYWMLFACRRKETLYGGAKRAVEEEEGVLLLFVCRYIGCVVFLLITRFLCYIWADTAKCLLHLLPKCNIPSLLLSNSTYVIIVTKPITIASFSQFKCITLWIFTYFTSISTLLSFPFLSSMSPLTFVSYRLLHLFCHYSNGFFPENKDRK